MTDTKLIFSLVDNAEILLEAGSLNTIKYPVIAIKVDQRQSIPDGVIALDNLIKPSGKTSFFFRDFFM